MDEPDRMFDHTDSSLERALLEAGRNYHGPADLRAHTLAALGVAATAGLASSGVFAWLGAKGWTTKMLMGLSAVTLMAAVPVSYALLHQEMAPAVAPAEPPALASAPLPEVPANPPLPLEAKVPAAVPKTAPLRVASTSARTGATTTSSALRAELAALDAVRSTLADGDAAGALTFLDAYFRTFPRGRLRLEAEALRIDALARAGRRDAAKRHAQEFLKRNPNSVLSARVQPYAGR
jgi:hypothetical protein